MEDVEILGDEESPASRESRLDVWEFAREVFIHGRKIRFPDVSESVHLGGSLFVSASPELEKGRPRVTQEIAKRIDASLPRPGVDAWGHAACFLVCPRRRVISRLEIPKPTGDDPCDEYDDLGTPA